MTTIRQLNFYPRSPCGERRNPTNHTNIPSKFLSTLSLRRATPRGTVSRNAETLFLSTLSLRRATRRRIFFLAGGRDFYPRSPCGERPNLQKNQHQRKRISIHALLAESDTHPITILVRVVVFLSTLSLRRATHSCFLWSSRVRHFYPRSPCGERHKTAELIINVRYFYPRSPCGERRILFRR